MLRGFTRDACWDIPYTMESRPRREGRGAREDGPNWLLACKGAALMALCGACLTWGLTGDPTPTKPQ